ncbi:alpha/beta fold hydrolase [Pararoseomonas sp. SCSIO 73927]|uniref:alpha/beta fold hydrolase n=1 Tax=Pararoseomonas sp. SCSIO 73927 TaxID=3114537 RepID=UPI0030CDB91E
MRDGTQSVRANGLLFHCRLDGPEGAPPMVFSNSLVTNLSVWNEQVAVLAGRHRILRYDQRGHGGTEVPPDPASLDVLAEDAAALMDVFGIRSAVVVGVSMGAATALLLAARRPDLVSAVIASDGQAATAPGGAQAWQDRMDLARQKGMEAFAAVTVARWFSPASTAAGHPAIPRVRDMIATTPEPGFVACARALQSYDIRAELPGLRQPVLLVAGAADGAMPTTMRAMTGSISNARFVEIPDAGHLPCIEAPGPFNAAVESFLAEVLRPA